MPEPLSPLDPIDEQPAHDSFFQRRVVLPLSHLLSTGVSPRRLAWSLAVGVGVGVNPLLGSTTVASLASAVSLRLNVIAAQIATHLAYPLQLALFFGFVHAGEILFRTGPIPLTRRAVLSAARHHPWDVTRMLWMWEWHALVVWCLAMCIAVPLLAATLTPMLRGLLHGLAPQPNAPTGPAR